jgi:hypothetical protein
MTFEVENMPKRKQSLPTLSTLIATTLKLRRSLEALVKRHPEGHLNLSDQIFVRFLNPLWRNRSGTPYRAVQRKELEAVAWIDQFVMYQKDVEGLIAHVMLQSEVFQKLPLAYYSPYPAEECIRRLNLQEAALKLLLAEESSAIEKPRAYGSARVATAGGGASGPLVELRRRVRPLVDSLGVKHVAKESGVNRDTITDFLDQRTARLQRRTVEKLEKFVNLPTQGRPNA